MRYLPLSVDLDQQPCLIVGGGEVAARKLALLKRTGALLTLVAPTLEESLIGASGFVWLQAHFAPGHLAGQRLVIAATDDPLVNAAVAAACRERGILVNVVDAPALCTVLVPSLVDRSPLVVSVSTSGAAPVLATRIRQRIEALLPAHYGALASFMGRMRTAVKERHAGGAARRRFWQGFLDGPIPDLLAEDETAAQHAFERLLAMPLDEALAPRCSLLTLSSPAPADLTLGGLARLSDADCLLFAANIPEAIRDLARRDASVIEFPTTADWRALLPPSGHTVVVTLRAEASAAAHPQIQDIPHAGLC